MKMLDLQKAQTEMLNTLEARAKAGDNQAAEIYLNQLRQISQDIALWQKEKDEAKKSRKTL